MPSLRSARRHGTRYSDRDPGTTAERGERVLRRWLRRNAQAAPNCGHLLDGRRQQRIAGTYRGLEEVFGYFRRRRFVPGISHFLVQEKPTLCNRVMIDFLTQEPVAMVAPIRTRGAGRGVRTRD